MSDERIYYTKPSITEREVAYATDAATNGWGDRCYEYIHRFEELFKAFVGSRYAIATSSCTGALHMGLAALGIGPGAEVILADINWIATAAPITYLGATPVFVDILPDTWCIDPDLAEAAITPQTKAIIATHLYGNVCEMDHLLEIGRKHGIPIVEDAAEAIGSRWQGRHAGSMGLFGVFSFHGTKTLTTGEGGAFVTSDPNLYETVLTLSNHGRSRTQTKQFWPDCIGFKYKMANVQAAIGCAQVERAEELIQRKREIFCYYFAKLAQLPGISMNPEKEGTSNGFWMPTVVFAKSESDLCEMLWESGAHKTIDVRVFFHPLSSLGLLPRSPKKPNSVSISSRALNLPSYHDLSYEKQDRVIRMLLEGIDLRRSTKWTARPTDKDV